MTGSLSAEDRARLAGGRLTIDLDALSQNWKFLDRQSGPAECAAAVKGNGYGIGLEQAVSTLADAGCRTFFVALPEEGIRARQVAPAADIYVLNGLIGGTGEDLLAHRLRPVLSCEEEVAEWRALASRLQRPLAAAIHVDTGMNRLGMREEDAAALVDDPAGLAGIDVRLVISHLACGSDPDHPLNDAQRASFQRVRARLAGIPGSLANSAGIFLGADYRHDMVRPGISLYGGAALDSHLSENPMRPVVKVEARILQVRTVPAGEGVGYGSAETVKRDSRVAIVAAGYADGYHRRAGSSDESRGAHGICGQRPVPIVGRVSMDLIAFDVTDCPGPGPRRGDWITLFGADPSPGSVAAHAQTIDYELLTGLGSRYCRRYVSASKPSSQD